MITFLDSYGDIDAQVKSFSELEQYVFTALQEWAEDFDIDGICHALWLYYTEPVEPGDFWELVQQFDISDNK